MKLDEVGNITINGVKPHVHELVHSILKNLERDYDLSFIKPFYKHVKIKQDKHNPNLVKITLRLPESAKPVPGTLKLVNEPGKHMDQVEREEFQRRAKPILQELLIQLRAAVNIEDDAFEQTRDGPQLFVVSDNFISESLVEAPVGMLSRAATKLKSKVPFAPGLRAQAKGEELTNKAANQLWLAYQQWVGAAKKNANKMTANDLLAFFADEEYAVSARKVIQQAAQQKKKAQAPEAQDKPEDNKVVPPSQDAPGGDPAKADDATKKAFRDAGLVAKESFQTRLNSFLGEEVPQAEVAPITFNKKEVEKLILAIVAKVAEEKPKALAAKVKKKATEMPAEQDTKAEPEQTADTTDYEAKGARIGSHIFSAIDEYKGIDQKAKDGLKAEIQRRLESDPDLMSELG